MSLNEWKLLARMKARRKWKASVAVGTALWVTEAYGTDSRGFAKCIFRYFFRKKENVDAFGSDIPCTFHIIRIIHLAREFFMEHQWKVMISRDYMQNMKINMR